MCEDTANEAPVAAKMKKICDNIAGSEPEFEQMLDLLPVN